MARSILIMAVRHLIFYFTPFNIFIADMYVSTQTGDKALAGQEETIQIKTFPPDNSNKRTIWFKGYYLSIYNEQTEDCTATSLT